MQLRIIKLHNFLVNLSVWGVYNKKTLDKIVSYMTQTTFINLFDDGSLWNLNNRNERMVYIGELIKHAILF